MRHLPVLLLLACSAAEEEECDAMAAVSVFVDVVGPDTATVTYEADGVETACDAWPDGSGYACGYEVAGELTIRVVAEGYEDWQSVVVVARDDCHVIQEDVSARLTVS